MAKLTTAISRPQRWDVPFGPDMTEADADRVLAMEPFASIDPAKFPPATSLSDIILNDCRVTRHSPGEIVVREGDYGSSLFFIMSGTVRVVQSLPGQMIGRAETKPRGIFRALAQLWTNHRSDEYRDVRRYGAQVMERQTRVFLQDIPAILNEFGSAQLSAGELFGELAALTRGRRRATVFAEDDCELLEMRWQGFRDIRRRADELRRHVDKLYRERRLTEHLHSTPIFAHLNDEQLRDVADQTVFETYGDFDWYASYQKIAEEDPAKRLAHEPIIAEEGSYPNGLIMISSGFVRVSMKFGNGERTMSYLGRGKTYGFEEIAHNHRHSPPVPLQRTIRAVGYVNVLRVPTVVIEKYVLGEKREAAEAVHLTQAHEVGPMQHGGKRLRSSMVEFLVENRFINGSATMIIDLDRCTRCDDCVRACAEGHDNNPRFIRHGPQFDHYMVANACMHCADPVCMIGCPTGAIHRSPHGGQVVINDDTCIGCSTCANSCPYNNIRMVEIRDSEGEFIIDKNSNMPLVKATKCDLCVDQLGGPACQRACPHDALKRVDMADLAALEEWLVR